MLGVSTKAVVLSLLDGLRRDGEMGALMIMHDLLTAGRVADRIVVMYLGRIVEQEMARDVLHDTGIPTRGVVVRRPVARSRRPSCRGQILRGRRPTR